MKKTILFSAAVFTYFILQTAYCFSQGTAINSTGAKADSSAILDLSSTAKGFAMPRMTTTQRNAISSPVQSLLIYNTTSDCFEFYAYGSWNTLGCATCNPPAPAEGVHVPSQTQIEWNWNTVSGASGYKWNTMNDYFSASDNLTSTTHTEINLTCGTAYSLYVWSYNTCGHSSVSVLTQSTSACPDACNNQTTMTDTRDSKVYNIVATGSQCWLKQNLEYDQSGYGSDWCYANNPANCTAYGRLYNWDAIMQGEASSGSIPSGVKGVCPSGWHLPSDGEWCQLENFIETNTDPACTVTGFRGTYVGTALKSGGSSGFVFLLNGDYSGGSFYDLGSYGHIWSCTENGGADAYFRRVEGSRTTVYRNAWNKGQGYGVRCILD